MEQIHRQATGHNVGQTGIVNGRTQVIVATSVMLSFISFWRAAAIVLNDLGSSAFYVGGIAEKAVGPAAPWFVLGVMLFANGVRAIYIESSAMFTRGGVYRVVKEAMGGTLAKLSVSALIFDYVLTAPITGETTVTPAETRYHLPKHPGAWLGLIGILIAFGHSLLAMSGEESLAQVNRELEYPKHKNLVRAAIVIALYALLFTSLVSFFAYAIIPEGLRGQYRDNLISGIAMYLVLPRWLKL